MLYMFDGDKGGVGKSFDAKVFADYLISRRGLRPLIVEADMRNPDVARMYESVTDTALVNLRDKEGWWELSSVLHEAQQRPVVLSLPGNMGDAMQANMPAFAEVLHDLKCGAVMFWVLSREADSINLLRVASDAFGHLLERTVAVRNLRWGPPAKFVLWNQSKIREQLIEKGALEIDLEDLHDLLVEATVRARPPVRFSDAEAARDPANPEQGLRYGLKAELRRWVQTTFRTFDSIALKIGLANKASKPAEPAA